MDISHKQTRNLPIRLDLPEGRIEAEVELPYGPMRRVDFALIALGLSSTVAGHGGPYRRQPWPPGFLQQRM